MTNVPMISSSTHGGILVPFDMFRLSQLAAVYGELLASKARNILDAKLVAIRQESGNLLLLRIEGHVVENDPAEFWRLNADLALLTSQLLPHRVLAYWARSSPPERRREGFLFAQRGQVIASDEASAEQPPNGGQWPVTKLCEQMRLPLEDLAEGFPGCPRVEVPLVDRAGVDDQELLKTLLGQGLGIESSDEGGDELHGRPQSSAAPVQPKTNAVEDDTRRRAAEAAAEAADLEARATAVQTGLAYTLDDLGIINMPSTGLSEAQILTNMIAAQICGELPAGVPRELTDRLQGKRSDVAVLVDFLSEVFIDDTKPLSKPVFVERAAPIQVGTRTLRCVEVLAPRIGYGTLLSNGSRHVFVSRKPELAMPTEVLERLFS